jgi:hypothetical protein
LPGDLPGQLTELTRRTRDAPSHNHPDQDASRRGIAPRTARRATARPRRRRPRGARWRKARQTGAPPAGTAGRRPGCARSDRPSRRRDPGHGPPLRRHSRGRRGRLPARPRDPAQEGAQHARGRPRPMAQDRGHPHHPPPGECLPLSPWGRRRFRVGAARRRSGRSPAAVPHSRACVVACACAVPRCARAGCEPVHYAASPRFAWSLLPLVLAATVRLRRGTIKRRQKRVRSPDPWRAVVIRVFDV